MPSDLPPEPASALPDRGPAEQTFPDAVSIPFAPAPAPAPDGFEPGVPAADAGPPATDPPSRPPGPGLPEAIAWCVGWFVTVQLVLMIPAWLAVQSAGRLMLGRALTPGETSIVALPTVQLLGALLTLAAFRWRVGPLRKLGLGLPSGPTTAVAFLSLPAVMIACTQWGAAAGALWAAACEFAPGLEAMDRISSLNAVHRLLRTVPFPALALSAAVCPAVAEELFCRGLLGRGLVARWGVTRGVAITSVLFCLLHLHPAHAGALMPLTVLMHLSYLASRSLWLPIGLHFANNFTSLALGKALLSRDLLPAPHQTPPPNVALLILTTALAGLACWAVWSVRVRTVRLDAQGRPRQEVVPRWPTVEAPPRSAEVWSVVRWRAVPLALWGLFVPTFGALVAASVLAVLWGGAEI